MSADSWIKFRTKLPKDGRLRMVSRSCHADVVTDVVAAADRRNALVTLALGALARLWCLADDHADADGVLLGYTAEDVDAEVGVRGFCASLPPEWVDLSGPYVKLPDYQDHNGTTGKSRAQATKRKKKERSAGGAKQSRNERDNGHDENDHSSRDKRDTSVTREEKNREEDIQLGNSSTHVGTEGVGDADARALVLAAKALRKLGMQDVHITRPELIDLVRRGFDAETMAMTAAEITLRKASMFNDTDLHPELLELCASGATQQQMALTSEQFQHLRRSVPKLGYLQKAVIGRAQDAAANATSQTPPGPRQAQKHSATSIIKGTEYAPTDLDAFDPELRAGVAARLND